MLFTNSVALCNPLFFIKTLTSDPHDRGLPDTSQMKSKRVESLVIRLFYGDYLKCMRISSNNYKDVKGRS